MAHFDRAPIRADMATIINAPMGISEAALMTKAPTPISSALLSKRKELKDMLVSKLTAAHGGDPMRKAVITREVESSALLRSGKLTSGGLKALEESVATAVNASRSSGKIESLKPPPSYAPDWSGSELAEKVKSASNWTEIANHRAAFYNIEQQKKNAEKAHRKEQLRNDLMHQMALESHRKAAHKELVAEDARQVAANLAEYERDMAAAAAAKKAKVEVEKERRAAQMRERQARAAAVERLQQLEDEEIMAHIRREQALEREKKLQKQRENEAYHMSTASENIRIEKQREEQKQTEWAEENRLNTEWKAMLDKQETDRRNHFEGLREKIKNMQKGSYANLTAALENRLREEEMTRQRYMEQHEKELDEAAEAKRLLHKKRTEQTKDFIGKQIEVHKRMTAAEKEADRQYAAGVRKEVAAGDEKEAHRKALQKVAMAEQMHHLNEQVKEKREQALRDPGASEMTAIEATLNRPLLVSMVQHQYNNMHVLN